MQVQYRPELMAEPKLQEIVRSATPVLEEAIGPPASRVTVTWGLRQDESGRTLIQLRVADWSVEAAAEFAPKELQPPDSARRRFIRLWGDLLQEASRRQIQLLEAASIDE